MNKETFLKYKAQGYNRVPLVQEVLADLDTPVSTYLKLASGPYSYLFESVQGGEKWGRYSIIGLPCRTIIKVNGIDVSLENDGQLLERTQCDDPLAWVESYIESFKVPDVPSLPRFNGGLVGYFGYDTVRYIEPKLKHCPNNDQLKTPEIMLMVSEELIVFDNLRGKLFVVLYVDPGCDHAYEQGQVRLEELVKKLHEPKNIYGDVTQRRNVSESDFKPGFRKQAFERAVDDIKHYIREGDVMQVVLSQRLSIPYHAAPFDLYRALRSLNPSPYMFYLNMGDFHIAGSSPEILVHVESGDITVRPIAGTRPRGKTEEEDKALEQDLLADPKEIAEHLMLIDLGRNDVGRVAEVGSVELTDKMVIERYSHVMHIVSNVCGRLKPDFGPIQALKATFPAGTLSGASKVRAMEIIDELEPVKRGIYGGAIGYIGWNGNMDTAIAIRTAIIKDETLYIQAGAGVVADSVPENEWEETLNKGRAIFRAVAMAEAGIDRTSSEGESVCY